MSTEKGPVLTRKQYRKAVKQFCDELPKLMPELFAKNGMSTEKQHPPRYHGCNDSPVERGLER